MAGTSKKVKSIWASTEVTLTLSGGQTSDAVATESLPFASVQIAQPSGTAITSVQPQISNDNVTWIALGSAIAVASLPVLQDLYSAAGGTSISPPKYVRFVVAGGDGTSVIQIVINLMGSHG